MAAKRIAKSSVEWAAIVERVPAKQKDAFKVLKTASDKYVNRVSELPQALPKIDFTEYRRRISDAAMVAEFEKMYSALDVPYPKDTLNAKAKLQAEEKAALDEKNHFVAETNLNIERLKKVLAKMDSVPEPEQMTMQMYNYYFPEAQINPNKENPAFWPQDEPRAQIDTMHLHGFTFFNTPEDYRHMQTWDQFEEEWRLKVEAQEKAKLKKEPAKQETLQ